jgi:hypothetical protein
VKRRARCARPGVSAGLARGAPAFARWAFEDGEDAERGEAVEAGHARVRPGPRRTRCPLPHDGGATVREAASLLVGRRLDGLGRGSWRLTRKTGSRFRPCRPICWPKNSSNLLSRARGASARARLDAALRCGRHAGHGDDDSCSDSQRASRCRGAGGYGAAWRPDARRRLRERGKNRCAIGSRRPPLFPRFTLLPLRSQRRRTGLALRAKSGQKSP